MSTDENMATTEDGGASQPEGHGGEDAANAAEQATHRVEVPAAESAASEAPPAAAERPETAPAETPPAQTPGEPAKTRPWYEEPEWAEEPGDDIGNRLPHASMRDDVGNRKPAGRGAPPQRDARPAVKHDLRAPKAAPAAPRSVPEAGAPAGEATPAMEAKLAIEATPPIDAKPEAEATPAGEGKPEGESGGGGAEAAAATAVVEGAPAPAKKRRRRRRRKGGAAAKAASQGTDAPETSASAEGEAASEGGEAEAAAEGDDDGAAEGEGAEAEGDEEHEGAVDSQGAPAVDAHGAPVKKERGKKRKGPPPARERPAFGVGEEVFGKVARVTDDAVWIDIAGKAMGLFDRRELSDEEPPAEGDQFLATVASNGVRGGMLMLSRAPADVDKAKALLEAALASGETVEGFVTGAVKGGLEVDIAGVRAFAPASHVDLRHGADLGYLVGQRLGFVVAQYAKKGRDVVVSRKKMLEEEARKARAEALAQIAPGSVHKGVVRTVMQWGVFVALPDAGGVEGLVHMTEASHDRGAKLTEMFKPGDAIDVKVLRVDEKGKLWLSRKAAQADPWDEVKQKYAVGSRHMGKIARLQPFGAFIELEPGIDGLCHTADLALKPIEHPSEVVKVGDEIEVVVATCDSASHRIGLHPAPPAEEADEPRQRVQQYKAVKVAVVQVVEGGLVVRILGVTGRSSRAFIPAVHTGTPRGTDLRKEFPIGTRLEAKVLEIDPRRGEAKLSIRALKDDAEKQAYQQYRAGVAREAKFGTFADLLKKS